MQNDTLHVYHTFGTFLCHYYTITMMWNSLYVRLGGSQVNSKNIFFFRYQNSDLDLNNAGEPALPQFS